MIFLYYYLPFEVKCSHILYFPLQVRKHDTVGILYQNMVSDLEIKQISNETLSPLTKEELLMGLHIQNYCKVIVLNDCLLPFDSPFRNVSGINVENI